MKKIIVVEDKLREIFEYLPQLYHPSLDEAYDVTFKTGDQKELLAFFRQNERSQLYPLIWLDMPYEEIHKFNKSKCKIEDINFIIAVETSAELLSSERLSAIFKPILYPLLNLIIESFTQATTVNMSSDFKVTKYCNYDDNFNDKSENGDLWDAIKLTCDLEFNSNCLQPIKLANQSDKPIFPDFGEPRFIFADGLISV